MASSSSRRYGSSGRSARRKQVVIGAHDTSDVRYDRAEPKKSPNARQNASQNARQNARQNASAPPRTSTGRPSDRSARPAAGAGRRIANDKRKERDRRRRAIARRRTAFAILLAALLGLACWGVVSLRNSSLFAVQKIEVTGARHLTAESIATSASIPADATLLNLSTGAVKKRILAQPWVAEVRVSRRIPHTIRISVTERTAALAVKTSSSAVWLVSNDGRWLESHSVEETFSVPTVTDIEGLQPVAGTDTGSAEIKNALAIAQGLSEELKDRLQRISASSVDETLLVLNGPIEVYIGSADEIATKDRIVRGILGEQKDVVYVNVRVVDRPTWRGLKD